VFLSVRPFAKWKRGDIGLAAATEPLAVSTAALRLGWEVLRQRYSGAERQWCGAGVEPACERIPRGLPRGSFNLIDKLEDVHDIRALTEVLADQA